MTVADRQHVLDLVAIPAGRFTMGSDRNGVDRCVRQWSDRLVDPSYADRFESFILKELPQHEQSVAAFQIGRFPITNRQYADFVDAVDGAACESLISMSAPDHPAWGMAWDDCSEFVRWLGQEHGLPYRLPSEIEWEYAARGPFGQEYPFGDIFDAARCNTIEAGIGETTPVTRYAQWPSPFGVCDMAGNVEEWTGSLYEAYPGGYPIEDDLWFAAGEEPYPVLRGGSFALGGDLARGARRHGPHPGPRFKYRGFRIALSEA